MDPMKEWPNDDAPNQTFVSIESNGTIHADQTGQFPVTECVVSLLCDHDSNAVLTKPVKNRAAPTILRAHTKLVNCLKQRGFRPQVHWLDNKALNLAKTLNKENQIEHQLVPPHMRCRNAVEQAVQTWKNHLLAGPRSTGSQFPARQWDCSIAQATLMLNLLCPSRCDPKVSACSALEGTFDFNKTPMAPPGTKVIVHKKTAMLLMGPPWHRVMERRERCSALTNATQAERTSDTGDFFHQNLKVPFLSANDVAVHAANELVQVLKNPGPANPLTQVGSQQLEALQQLADVFQTNTKKVLPKFPECCLSQSSFPLSLSHLRGRLLQVLPNFRGWSESVLLCHRQHPPHHIAIQLAT